MVGVTVQKAGANFDNEMCNVIDEATTGDVFAHSMRGSGNTLTSQPDVKVITPVVDHAIEGKRYTWDPGQRRQVMDPEDVEQLGQCANKYTQLWLALKFTRRELIVLGPLNPYDVGESIVELAPDCIEASYTDSGYVRATKPETGEWPSQQAGRDDRDVLLDALDLEPWLRDDDA